MLDGELVFLPNDIPRRGVFALWGKAPGNAAPGNAKVELVFPGGTYGIRKRRVSAELIPVAEALPLRSASDPSLIVDAASLWSQPETVLARFGPQAETDLLLALRRGAAAWPPLAQVLEQASPSEIDLDDDALTSLLGPAAEALAGAGIEVMWPSSMVDRSTARCSTRTRSPPSRRRNGR